VKGKVFFLSLKTFMFLPLQNDNKSAQNSAKCAPKALLNIYVNFSCQMRKTPYFLEKNRLSATLSAPLPPRFSHARIYNYMVDLGFV
jgi:hypothetical protein